MKFAKTKLAAAIAAATLATSAQAVVVVGGDNGWEISFDGNINLFYNQIDMETDEVGTLTAGGAACSVAAGNCAKVGVADNGGNGDSSHLQEGLLPAFFSFSAKSPTVNGLTGTARISFAPDSSSAKNTFNDKGGSAIDMREVVANVDGSFGQISFGRTLGLFQRQAILKDQTLFGVGDIAGVDNGGTTLGRIGNGYTYPEFRTRFAYTTTNINGFVLAVGLFDPQEPFAGSSAGFETDTPKFEAEATYATTFSGGSFNAWVGGTWQEMDNVTAGIDDDVTSAGWNIGAQVAMSGFEITGSYYDGHALGTDVKNGVLGAGTINTVAKISAIHGVSCATAFGTAPGGCEAADNDGFYVQGAYTFGGKTKVAGSYGESNQDGESKGGAILFNDISHEMWTVGVYHDVTSWLKLVAEYNNGEKELESGLGGVTGLAAGTDTDLDWDAFSVGAFMTW
jgi:hypothetical protein